MINIFSKQTYIYMVKITAAAPLPFKGEYSGRSLLLPFYLLPSERSTSSNLASSCCISFYLFACFFRRIFPNFYLFLDFSVVFAGLLAYYQLHHKELAKLDSAPTVLPWIFFRFY
jgi:hypothetical protein